MHGDGVRRDRGQHRMVQRKLTSDLEVADCTVIRKQKCLSVCQLLTFHSRILELVGGWDRPITVLRACAAK
jgi:hypothetical protein